MSHLGVNAAYRKNIRVRSFAEATEGKSSVAADHSVGRVPQVATGLESLLDATRLSELELSYDQKRRVLWQFMAPRSRPTPGLLCDMTATLDMVESAFDQPAAAGEHPIDFLVLASRMPGIFNLGGDLPHFMGLIERKDEKRLRWYARVCARGQYRRAIDLQLPICTIALIQGDALGGGFEVALAHDVIIAERGARFGLPEILFNMFPGMGAFSFLARRLDPIHAERIILSGKVYSAEELHEIGVVDRLAEDGTGMNAVHEFVREYGRARHTRQAVLRARKIVTPVSLRELIEVADLWVETALKLGPTCAKCVTSQRPKTGVGRSFERIAEDIIRERRTPSANEPNGPDARIQVKRGASRCRHAGTSEFGELGPRKVAIAYGPSLSTGRLSAETRGAAGEFPLKAGEFPP